MASQLSREERVCQEQLELATATLDRMRKNKFLTDVTLVCEDNEFAAHRTHLCAASPYFWRVFHSQDPDAVNEKLPLRNITAEAMEILLEFMYNGSIPDLDPDSSTIRDVLSACDQLYLKELFNYYVRQKFQPSPTINYFLKFWQLATKYNHAAMLDTVLKFVSANFYRISHESDEFLKLSATQLQQLLAHPNMAERSPNEVLTAILSWVHSDKEERLCVLDAIVALVNVNGMPVNFVKCLLVNEPLVAENQAVFDRLMALVLENRTRCQQQGKEESDDGPDLDDDAATSSVTSDDEEMSTSTTSE